MTPTVVHRAVLAAAPPYDFALSVRALESFAPMAGEHRAADGCVRRAFAHPDPAKAAAGAAVVAQVDADSSGGVLLSVLAAVPLSATEAAVVERAVAEWLGLSDDLRGFHAAADADPAMAPVLRVARGLHQVRFPSLAEATIYFTLTQRSTQWFAGARRRRMAAELGPSLVVDGVVYRSFPSLEVVAGLDDETLLGYAGNAQRAARVREVAAGVAGLGETWLRVAPYCDARTALLAVPGVGPFTANALLLRGLGRPDEVPLEMRQFRLAAEQIYGTPPPTPDELRARYGPHIGWWSYVTRTAATWREVPAEPQAVREMVRSSPSSGP
jgi:3-methyladenine DNA glycosylase/8-oxoguanine DNA glycosylase